MVSRRPTGIPGGGPKSSEMEQERLPWGGSFRNTGSEESLVKQAPLPLPRCVGGGKQVRLRLRLRSQLGQAGMHT